MGAATPPFTRHLRYQREIGLRPGASGQACFALDATVFAHAASAGAGDLRIFRQDPNGEAEVPFALTESGTNDMDARQATVGNITARDGALTFDLAMPQGDYTDVALDLNARNFVGVAKVTGVNAERRSIPLGLFPIFDLTGEKLARSTVLTLPDSSYPILHVELRLFDPAGQPMSVSPSLMTGATVPPARQAQTIYTSVASASRIDQQGHWSATTIVVPPHVPVERVQFTVDPAFSGDFLRGVTVAATPMEKGWEAQGAAEGVSGNIFRVNRAPEGIVPRIDSQALTINTVIGANLRSPAKVTASVDNGTESPLPIDRVELQMRQRQLCFEARPGSAYLLRYGSPELSAPSYSYARHFVPASPAAAAQLGPEQRNPNYVAGAAAGEGTKPGRELPSLLLIAGVSVAGVTALQFVRHKREEKG